MSTQNVPNLISLRIHTPMSLKRCTITTSASSLELYFELLKKFTDLAAIGGGGQLSIWFNDDKAVQEYLEMLKNDPRTESINELASQTHQSTLFLSSPQETKKFSIISTVPSGELFSEAFLLSPCFKGKKSENELRISCNSEVEVQRYISALASHECTVSIQQV